MLNVGDYLIYTDPRIEQVAYRIGVRPYGSKHPDPERVAIMRGEVPFTRDMLGGFSAEVDLVIANLEKSGLKVEVDGEGVATISTGYVYDDAFRARLTEFGIEYLRFVSIDKVFARDGFTIVQGAFYGSYYASNRPSAHRMKRKVSAVIGTLRDGGIEKCVLLAVVGGSLRLACRRAATNLKMKVKTAEELRLRQDEERRAAEAEEEARRRAEFEALMVGDADVLADAFA